MKKIIILIFILCFSSVSMSQSNETIEVSLDQVVGKISNENLTVYESALRVYQTKESITFARMNLLPRLNLWKLASSAVEIFAGGPVGVA